MRKNILLAAIILAACFVACKKTNSDTNTIDKKMIGNWLVVGADNFRNDSGMVVEWGLYYVNKVIINADNSFGINSSSNRTGTWKLKDNESSIVFYSEVNDVGTIYRDTSEFKISVNSNDELILARNPISFVHKRIKD